MLTGLFIKIKIQTKNAVVKTFSSRDIHVAVYCIVNRQKLETPPSAMMFSGFLRASFAFLIKEHLPFSMA